MVDSGFVKRLNFNDGQKHVQAQTSFQRIIKISRLNQNLSLPLAEVSSKQNQRKKETLPSDKAFVKVNFNQTNPEKKQKKI